MNKLIQDQLTQQYGSLKDVPPDVLKLMKSISDSFDQTEIEVADENNQRLDTRGQQVQQTNAIAQVIISSKDIGQLYRNVVKAVQEKLSFDYVQLFRFNAGLESLSLVAGTGTAGTNLLNKGYQISLNNIGSIGKAATKQATVFIPNTAQDPTWVATPQIQETKSEISTPILLGGELLGVLNAQSNQLNTLSVDTQLVLEVLSGQIAVAIESLRLRTEMEEHIRELDALQRITSNEGWDNFRDTGSSQSQAYSFDGSTSEPQQVPNPAAKALSITSKPMAVRGEVIGAIGIKDDPDNPLNEEEQNLLESITEEVAEALERARLFESSQRSAAELKILNDMGNAFTESLNELAIVENIYIYAARLFPVEEFFVALYEKEDNMVTFPLAMHQGKRVDENHPNWNHWQPREPGIGLTGHIIREHMPILIENNAEKVLTDLNIPFESHGDLTQSWLGVPMALGDRLLGVISAQSETQAGLYKEHHLGLMIAIASQAAIAIDNARLFQQEQSRATQERLVRTITEQVRGGSNIQEIIKIALQELTAVFNADHSLIRLGTKAQLLPSKLKRTTVTRPELANDDSPQTNGTDNPKSDESNRDTED